MVARVTSLTGADAAATIFWARAVAVHWWQLWLPCRTWLSSLKNRVCRKTQSSRREAFSSPAVFASKKEQANRSHVKTGKLIAWWAINSKLKH